ncbi:MAG: hypothetical protein U1D97_06745 [Desulfuromonadales bacterium]|nr:hypothetical protein [Desulfuromonadales bacterium]
MKKDGKWSRLILACLLASALALGGCSDGDDGKSGQPGLSAYEIAVNNGFTGTEQEWLDSLQGTGGGAGPVVATPLETCTLCHGAGSISDPETVHAGTGQVSFTVNPGQPTVEGTELVIRFNLKLDGVNNSAYTAVNRAVVLQGVGGVFTRYAFDRNATNYTITQTVLNGDYTVRISRTAAGATAGLPDPIDFVGTDTRYYIRMAGATGSGLPNASVSFETGDYTRTDLVSNESCVNCHGDKSAKFTHHTNPFRAEACITCHSAVNPVGFGDYRSSLATVVHGIHNSYNMPGNTYTYNPTNVWYKVTYPTYMTNCSVCHDSPAALAEVNTMPVTGANCLSCHGSKASWAFTDFPAHPDFTGAITDPNCATCHSGATVGDFHNGLLTERSGVIWDGVDVSVTEGAKVDMQITGVTRTGNNLAVTWTAAYDGTAVNPCNDTVAAGAPVFHAGGIVTTTAGGVTTITDPAKNAIGQVNSNFSLLRAYGEGDDWTNNNIGTAPGQPLATNLDTTNTVCVGNVATTTIPLSATEIATTAVKGVVALQGKAQVKLPFVYSGTTVDVDQVRSKTPTREFVVATGALPATARRAIVDTAACLKCHVGSLYQHGGNRVDNVDMCVTCHNEASSEQNVRLLDGVDATEAYDGQAGQTYGFKSLLHAVHSAGETGKITMVYRTNGVYVWTAQGVTPPNWPGTGAQTVYGSVPAGTNPNGTTRTHNLHAPTYPRSLNDCAACHKPGTTRAPNQAMAVATTVNAGTVGLSTTTPPTAANAINGIGNDDTLQGAGAAACTSCHQGAVSKAHAYQNGWVPTTFPAGRQTILDAAQ